jgi:antitoxin ParD1/3/4
LRIAATYTTVKAKIPTTGAELLRTPTNMPGHYSYTFLPNYILKKLHFYQKLVILLKFQEMKNTSISLGNYFDQFVQAQVSAGRYKNVSEVIRAGLRLLETEENKVIALKNAIQEGINSPRVENFDFDENLKNLKAEKTKNG